MNLEASVKGAELYVDNGDSVSLFLPDSELYQEGWQFHWRQVLGPKVQLDSCNTKKPEFQAPGEGLDKLLFEVTAANDEEVITDTVLVFVGEVLGEIEQSLGESLLTSAERTVLSVYSDVSGATFDEVVETMEVGEPVPDAELEKWTADAEPLSLDSLNGREMHIATSKTAAKPAKPEEPVMPKQGFSKMLTMVRGWIGEPNE